MRPLVGLGLIGMGAVMVYGGITGRLAPMLAALAAPTALTERGDSSQSFWSKVFGGGLLVPGLDVVPGLPLI